MASLKDEVSPALARALARELRLAWPRFPTQRLTRGLADSLEPLELLARVDLIAERLSLAMPEDFSAAADVLWRALDSSSFTGWMTLPCNNFVAKRGLNDPDRALPLLAGTTSRFSSEFAIRPFIERHPERTYQQLDEWCGHGDEHVRRLVSEGTRPRLPWAPLLRGLIADPSPNVPLLDALVDDPSPYVRRSVSNHLNDISKDHPDIALTIAERWLSRCGDAESVVRHGLRTLIKRGDQNALALVGAGTEAPIELLDYVVAPERVGVGGAITLTFTLRLADDSEPCDAVIDYRVHYAGARGPKAPKVFKLTRRRLEPGGSVTVARSHSFEHVSIRRIHPGVHIIDLQVNGTVLGSRTVQITSRT